MKKAILDSVLYVIVFLLIQVVAGAVMMLIVGLTTHNADVNVLTSEQTVLSLVLFNAVTVILFLLLRWSPLSADYLRSRPWGVLFWSVIAALGTLIPSMRLQELMPEFTGWMKELADNGEQQLTELFGVRGGYAVVCLLAPVVEEMVFRGAVLRRLLSAATPSSSPSSSSPSSQAFSSPTGSQRGSRPWVAIALSALLFALAHINPAQMPHAFLMGLLLGWMYWRTGSIVPGVALHWANNTAAYFIFRLYPDPDIRLIDVFSEQQRAVMGAVAFSLLILVPAIYQLHLRMKRA